MVVGQVTEREESEVEVEIEVGVDGDQVEDAGQMRGGGVSTSSGNQRPSVC